MSADIEEPVITPSLPLKPMRDWILCRERKRSQTASGLLVPETAWGSPRVARWRVVAVGPRVKSVAVGDAVNVEAATAIVTEYGGEKWCGVRERHIWAKLTEDQDRPELQSDTHIHPEEIGGRKLSACGKYFE
jgi:co-chaperonin GroES (HSP10)